MYRKYNQNFYILRSDMIKIITKLVSLLFIIFISLLALLVCAPKDELSYYSIMDNKIKRLHKIQSPKIVLVGGSNLTFGIDSKRIEREFNLPVVNMSLQAGLGLEFMISQITNNVNKGDIILLSPEYILFSKNYKGDGEVIYRFIINNKKQIVCFSPYTLFFHARAFAPSLFHQYIKTLTKSVNSVYSKTNFNEYGDMIGHLKLEYSPLCSGEKNKSRDSSVYEIDYKKIERINNLNNKLTSIGAKLYYLFPVISNTGYKNNKDFNDKVAVTVGTHLKASTLSDNNKYIFNDNLFFDTEYHLGEKGRMIRTDYVINDLHHVFSQARPRVSF